MKIKKRSAGAVVFFKEGEKILYLLLRAYKNWDFPKGEIEPGEDELEAAKREVAEETGLTDLKFYDDFIETPPYSSGKIARFYIAQSPTKKVTLPISPELGQPEHHECRWFSYEEAKSLLNERLKTVLEWTDEKIKTLKNH